MTHAQRAQFGLDKRHLVETRRELLAITYDVHRTSRGDVVMADSRREHRKMAHLKQYIYARSRS